MARKDAVVAADGPVLYAEVSDDAHAAWVTATRVFGGNIATLAEVIGLELAALLDSNREKLPKQWRDRFAEADRLEKLRKKEQGRRGR